MTRQSRLALALLLPLCGCAFTPDLKLTPIAVPDHYLDSNTEHGTPSTPTPWWRHFDDPLLTSLVEEALQHNPDVDIALDRLSAARSYEAGSVSALLPSVAATAGGGHGSGNDETKGRIDPLLGSGLNSKSVPVVNAAGGFDAVWQLDLFGRTRLALTDARISREWLEAGRDAAREAIAADVGEAYIRYRAAQWELVLLHDALRTARDASALAHDRYRAGLRNGLDAEVAEREAETVAAAASLAHAALTNARSSLSVLLGRFPETDDERLLAKAPIPTTNGPAPESPPIELLQRRPDLRQAVADWQKAGIRRADAEAALLPRVSLTGVVGAERGPDLNGVTPGTHLWSVGPSMTWPLLDFGALDAAIDAADWQQRAALAAYRKSIVRAVAEVDRHRALLLASREQAQHLDAAVIASDAAAELAQARYEAGLTDFAAVADSDREAVRAKLAYTAAAASAAIEWIRLHVALGGGWADDGTTTQPPAYHPSPALLALFKSHRER